MTEPVTGIGQSGGGVATGKVRTGSTGTPGSQRRNHGGASSSASPALRNVPNMIVNKILHKKSPEPFATPPTARANQLPVAENDSATLATNADGTVKTEGFASNAEATNATADTSARHGRLPSLHGARESMLKEIRSKEPKLKLKSTRRSAGGGGLTLQLAAPNGRERANSFSSADNLSMKSGASGEAVTDGRENDDQAVLHGGDETDWHERMQQQIRHYEEKLKSARQELHDYQAAYVDELTRENSVESYSSTGSSFGMGYRRGNQFDSYNKRYKAEELKLQEKISKYEDKLNRLNERKEASDYSMMQGVKDHVSSLRRSVKSGLAQAQGNLHVPSFGKIFGSNSNITDETNPIAVQAEETSPHRRSLLASEPAAEWRAHVAEVNEIRRRTGIVEDGLSAMETRVTETGDGQEKLDDICAKLKVDMDQLAAEKDDAQTQLSAALERIVRLEGEVNELTASFDNQMEDMLLRLQNAQLQMSERCQEIDESVEKCEARVTELEHHDRQAITIGGGDSAGRTQSVVVVLINTTIAVLYTVLSYWLWIQRRLPRRVVTILPYGMLLLLTVFTTWLFR